MCAVHNKVQRVHDVTVPNTEDKKIEDWTIWVNF